MKHRTAQTTAALLLFTAAIAYRICAGLEGNHIQWLQNFSPVAAIALCGALYLPKRVALLLPLVALLLSDIVLNIHYGETLIATEMALRYVALGLIVVLGWSLRGKASFATVLPAGVAGSLLFYVITNTGSWIDQPGYAKTFAGWMQALTTGLPGYAPTWMFFRSTFVSDLLFTALFAACMVVTHKRDEATVPAGRLQHSA